MGWPKSGSLGSRRRGIGSLKSRYIGALSATPAFIAAQHATGSIPIVFANVADPVGQGLIASFAKPGGNTTGFGAFDFSMAGKWVQAIKEIAPSVTRIGVIYNPETGPYYASFLPFVETASGPLGVKTISIAIHKPYLTSSKH